MTKRGYTRVNNQLLDEIMATAKPNTFKIIMAVARKTAGWGKKADVISISQFQKMTGIVGRSTVHTAIQDAISEGFITRTKKGKGFQYQIADSPKIGLVPKQDQSQNRTSTSPKIGLIDSPKIGHTKEILKETNKERNGDGRFAEAVTAYENNIGMITPMLSDTIQQAVTEYQIDWILDAIKIAAQAGVHKWSYVNGILKRWQVQGFKESAKGSKAKEVVFNAEDSAGGYYV